MVICADKNVTIPGRTVQLVDVSLPKELREQDVNSILIEPTYNAKLPQHLMVARALSPVLSGRHALLQVMNNSPTAATIYKGTKVGIATPLHRYTAIKYNSGGGTICGRGGGPSVAALHGPAGPLVAGDHLRRYRSHD